MELESEILPTGNPDSGKKQHALAAPPSLLQKPKENRAGLMRIPRADVYGTAPPEKNEQGTYVRSGQSGSF
jgi:hypothetical protein